MLSSLPAGLVRWRALPAGLLLAGLAVAPAAARGRELDLGPAGTLWLPLPASWTVQAEDPVGPFPTWALQPPEAGGAVLLVTPTWGTLGNSAFDLRYALAREMEAGHREALAAAEAAGLPGLPKPEMFLQEAPAARVAWYLSVDPVDTDAPGDYARILRALVDVGGLRVSATLLHHRPDPELVQAVLWLLANARHEAIRRAETEQRLRLGGRSWALVLPLAGFDLEPPIVREDGAGVALAAVHPETGLVVSAFLEQAERVRDARAWRDEQRRRLPEGPLPASGVVTGELHGHPALQYDVKRAAGRRVDQRHVHAYLARGDAWVDVHLSKAGFRAGEESLFTDFLAGVRIEPAGAGAR